MANMNINGDLSISGGGTIQGHGILHEIKTVWTGNLASGSANLNETVDFTKWRAILIEAKPDHSDTPWLSNLILAPFNGMTIYVGANGPNNQYETGVTVTTTNFSMVSPKRIHMQRISLIR